MPPRGRRKDAQNAQPRAFRIVLTQDLVPNYFPSFASGLSLSLDIHFVISLSFLCLTFFFLLVLCNFPTVVICTNSYHFLLTPPMYQSKYSRDLGAAYPQRDAAPKFKPVDSIYEGRLRQFIDRGGQYPHLNLPAFYNDKRECLSDVTDPDDTTEDGIWLSIWHAPKESKPLFKEVIPAKLDEFEQHEAGHALVMGPKWTSHWVQVKVRLSNEWFNGKTNTFLWDAGCEAMVFGTDGCPLQGLTGDGERTECDLPEDWFCKVNGKREATFYIECGCNSMFGGGGDTYGLKVAEIVQYNAQAKALFFDFLILSDAARENNSPPQKHKAREICNQIMDAFDPEDVASLDKCREIAKEFLGPNVDSQEVFKNGKALNKYGAVYAIGNCHIDTAWLWTFSTSKTKIARSWSSQLRLIEKYPEYVFVASAALHFKWLVEYYPDLYKKVKKAALDGRFIPLGGSWVENDTNLPSGEGLARQFLLGQRYFQHLFGVKSDIFWLPDSFGYSSQVPQICRLSGIPNFLTQKLSWNNINKFPQNSFNWVGIDNSQVLVHMPPDNTYTADANYGDVKRTVFNHQNLYNDQKGMLLYGKGDGGGGPTPEMVEKLRRCRGFSDTAGGDFPQVEMGATVRDFYNDLRKDTDNGAKLPSWRGELYLEYHRGTYTTQAKVKNFMRTIEHMAKNVELVATYASLFSKGFKYPLAQIEAIWSDICLCQFHDVLPGSCINKVYTEEVWPILAEVLKKEHKLLNSTLETLGFSASHKEGTELIKLSSLPWEKFSIESINSPSAEAVTKQSEGNFVAFSGKSVLKPLTSAIKYPSTIKETSSGFVLSNGKLSATVNKNGVVTSLLDLLTDREIIDQKNKSGGNQYVMYSDTPLNYPAWDTELFSLEKFKLVGDSSSAKVKYSGPLVSSIEIKHKLSDTSEITTVISLEGLNSLETPSALKFDCHVNWHEDYKFLKVQFPVTIISETASYETQFGITKRPTHFNTSWDVAKFEVCMHKFMDFSDFNYGVSVINNNKYGGSIHGSLMTLSLLRAPKYPDEKADLGEHHFSYAILPHAGPLGVETVRAGWEFNERMPSELYVAKEDVKNLSKLDTLVDIAGDDNIVLSYVKRGEDDSDVDYEGGLMTNLPKKYAGSQTVVLRFYEALGGKGRATVELSPKLKIKQVMKVNLLEEEMEEIELKGTNGFCAALDAFEISTYKVILK